MGDVAHELFEQLPKGQNDRELNYLDVTHQLRKMAVTPEMKQLVLAIALDTREADAAAGGQAVKMRTWRLAGSDAESVRGALHR